MIKAARLSKQITVTVINKIGVLADIAKLLAEHSINVEGLSGYALDNEAKIMLVSDDNLRTLDALKKSGYKSAKEEEVVIIDLENKPGALKLITVKLASQGIDIKQVYGTVCGIECPAKIILSTSDNEKSLIALKK